MARKHAIALLILLAAALGALAPGQTDTRPASNLDYWLGRAAPDSRPAASAAPATNPFGRSGRFRRPDAVPGVAILSDGTVHPGGLYTTRDRNWEVWVESEKRWRHIPPILVLSIRAAVIEEGMDKEWRWKEMGSDEKVFTGRTRPTRRLEWTFHLIDGSYLTGSVKGQPLWVESAQKRHGPFVLHERSAGNYGQSLKDLVYVKQVVISRRAMQQVLDAPRASSAPAS